MNVVALAAVCLLAITTVDGMLLGLPMANSFMFGGVPRFFHKPGVLNVMGHPLNVGRSWFGRPEPGYGAYAEPEYGPIAEPGFSGHAEPSYDGHYPMYAGPMFKK